MRTILVDDEKPALDNLKRKLGGISEFEVIGSYQDELKALEDLPKLMPDIIFVDIEMRYMNGLQFLEHVFDLNIYPKIVFVTAYPQYAQEAFELNAFDFIKKPVARERLIKTIEKIDFQKKVLLSGNSVPDRIRINCFREFTVCCNDTELSIKWRTKKVEELFLYLLCNYDKAVPKDKLVNILWDNIDQDRGLQYLYNTMYNLKKIENGLFCLESANGKIGLKLGDTYCDIMEFDKEYQKYKAGTLSSSFSLDRMKRVYKGTLLEEYDYSWLLQYQRMYENMWMRMNQRDKKYR